MKKLLSSLSILCISFFTLSCQDTSPTSKTPIEPLKHHIQLNEGKLWNANIETTQGVENMIRIMSEFSEKESIDAFANLTIALKKEFSSIFKNCTMKGAAHDQLHHFLIPIKDSFTNLTSSNIAECQQAYDQLYMHLHEYKKYFQ